MVVLATHRKIPSNTICTFPGVAKAFVLKYRNKFKTSGTAAIFAPQTKSNRKIDDSDLRNAVFGLLHEPPTNHGINRTSWTMPLLSRVLKENGRQIGTAVIAKMIKGAGYKAKFRSLEPDRSCRPPPSESLTVWPVLGIAAPIAESSVSICWPRVSAPSAKANNGLRPGFKPRFLASFFSTCRSSAPAGRDLSWRRQHQRNITGRGPCELQTPPAGTEGGNIREGEPKNPHPIEGRRADQ
jgi:hypothetical protein